MHLVKLEPGRLEFRPSPRAPRTLAGDLQQKLRDWTGSRWSVSISNQAGEPTIADSKKNAKAARIEAVMQSKGPSPTTWVPFPRIAACAAMLAGDDIWVFIARLCPVRARR